MKSAQLELQLIRKAISDCGILASIEPIGNYQRVWARDAVIAGLAGVAWQDKTILKGLQSSLEVLMQHQAPNGHIPSNVTVSVDPQQRQVSYGTRVRRVDTNAWYIVGVCQLLHRRSDPALAKKFQPSLERALSYYQSIEVNGSIQTPLGGNWADDYPLEGHLFYDQILKNWAETCYEKIFGENQWVKGSKIEKEKEEAVKKFWNTDGYWRAGFNGIEPYPQFDLFGNSLALYLGWGNSSNSKSVVGFVKKTMTENNLKSVPAFWPPIFPEERDWTSLLAIQGPEFKNYPYEYHNGGGWPMLLGWWGLTLWRLGLFSEAQQMVEHIERINADFFPEYINTQDAKPKGTMNCTWSAATVAVLKKQLSQPGDVLLC